MDTAEPRRPPEQTIPVEPTLHYVGYPVRYKPGGELIEDMDIDYDFNEPVEWLGEDTEYMDSYFADFCVYLQPRDRAHHLAKQYYIGHPLAFAHARHRTKEDAMITLTQPEVDQLKGGGDGYQVRRMPDRVQELIREACDPQFDIEMRERRLDPEEKGTTRYGPWCPRTRDEARELLARAAEDSTRGIWRARWNFAIQICHDRVTFQGTGVEARNFVAMSDPLPAQPPIWTEENPSVNWNAFNLLWYYQFRRNGEFPTGTGEGSLRARWDKLRYFLMAAKVFPIILRNHGEGLAYDYLAALALAVDDPGRFIAFRGDTAYALRPLQADEVNKDEIVEHLRRCGLTRKAAKEWKLSFFDGWVEAWDTRGRQHAASES